MAQNEPRVWKKGFRVICTSIYLLLWIRSRLVTSRGVNNGKLYLVFFADLNKQFTAMIYESISRSLFQDHVLVFSFILCVGILRQGGEINEDSWTCLLELAKPDSSHSTKSNEFFDLDKPFWLTERQWEQIHRASKRLDCLARCDKRHFDCSISCKV